MEDAKNRHAVIGLLAGLVFFGIVAQATAENGLVTVRSAHDVKTSADRLEAALAEKGMAVFLRMDHGANAAKVDVALRPMVLLIFGNPSVGAPLMECAPTAGIDLPQKALIREGSTGEVWFSYNDPRYIAERHAVEGCEKPLRMFETALARFAEVATLP